MRTITSSVGSVVQWLPYKMRWSALLAAHRWLRPVYAWLPTDDLWLDTAAEGIFYRVVRARRAVGLCFGVPGVRVAGEDLITRAYAQGGKVLFLSGHYRLNFLFLRWLRDRGYRPAVIYRSRSPALPNELLGTREPAVVIERTPTMFVRARRWLMGGGVVAALAEGVVPHPRREVLTIGGRTRYIATGMFEFAARIGTPVLYFAARLDPDGRSVRVSVEAPPDGSAEAMRDGFVAALRRWTAEGRPAWQPSIPGV